MPKAPSAVVSVQNACVRRGFVSLTFSSMHLMRYPLGTEICIWDCKVDHVQRPWNSDAQIKSHKASVPLAKCRPIPQNFFAVQFSILLEVHMPHAIPELFSPTLLRTMNLLSLKLEEELLGESPEHP